VKGGSVREHEWCECVREAGQSAFSVHLSSRVYAVYATYKSRLRWYGQ